MKFKGLSKIAIAGAALAATAATLGTSTYAWYVSNDKVAMDGVTGATAGEEVGANLVISGNEIAATGDSPASWGPKVKLTKATDGTEYTTEGTSSLFLATALDPQSMDESAQTETWKDNEGTDITTKAKFIEFKIWIKNSKDALLEPRFGVANTTDSAALKTQTAYNPNGLPTGVNSGDSFTVDAVQALRMEITKESVAAYSGASSTLQYTGDSITKEIFKVAEASYKTNLEDKYATDTTIFKTGGDANEYYKNMKGIAAYNTTGYGVTDGAGTSKASVYTNEKAEWGKFNVKADEAIKLTFRIWLEGADKDCWDSCIAQTFAFNLNFAVTKEQNNQQTNP